jgi:hypothetical protein
MSRQQIAFKDADFFKEPGLWVGFTEYEEILRSRMTFFDENWQVDPLKHYMKSRIAGTSLNTFMFVPDSSRITPGECVRSLDPTQVEHSFRHIFQKSMGALDYLITEDILFEEVDGSYTVQYYSNGKFIGKTRMVKISAESEFVDFGLTITSSSTQPVCVNWSSSLSESWSLDANEVEIEIEGQVYFNDFQIRKGLGDDGVVYDFKDWQNKWGLGVYAMASDQVLQMAAHPINAGINWNPEMHFFASGGFLEINHLEPLKFSGNFVMKREKVEGEADVEVSGSFIFDYSEYFEDKTEN